MKFLCARLESRMAASFSVKYLRSVYRARYAAVSYDRLVRMRITFATIKHYGHFSFFSCASRLPYWMNRTYEHTDTHTATVQPSSAIKLKMQHLHFKRKQTFTRINMKYSLSSIGIIWQKLWKAQKNWYGRFMYKVLRHWWTQAKLVCFVHSILFVIFIAFTAKRTSVPEKVA